MDRTRRLTEEALGEAGLEWRTARRRAPGRRLDADADGPLLRFADGRQAASHRSQCRRGRRAGGGHPGGDRGGPDIGDAVPRFTLATGAAQGAAKAHPGRAGAG